MSGLTSRIDKMRRHYFAGGMGSKRPSYYLQELPPSKDDLKRELAEAFANTARQCAADPPET